MQPKKPIRIVIADDNAMVRKSLAFCLTSYEGFELVGDAVNGREALDVCAKTQPDIVLMDLLMPVMDGITATRHIRHDFPLIKVIALTSFGDEPLIKEVLEAGVISYLFKMISVDDLAYAIRAAHEGISTYAPEVTELFSRM